MTMMNNNFNYIFTYFIYINDILRKLKIKKI